MKSGEGIFEGDLGPHGGRCTPGAAVSGPATTAVAFGDWRSPCNSLAAGHAVDGELKNAAPAPEDDGLSRRVSRQASRTGLSEDEDATGGRRWHRPRFVIDTTKSLTGPARGSDEKRIAYLDGDSGCEALVSAVPLGYQLDAKPTRGAIR